MNLPSPRWTVWVAVGGLSLASSLVVAQAPSLPGPGGPPGPQLGAIPSVDWRRELAPLVGRFRARGEGRRQGARTSSPWEAVADARWVLGESVLRQELTVSIGEVATFRAILWYADDPGGKGACVSVFVDDGSVAGPAQIVRGDPEVVLPRGPGMGTPPPVPDLRCVLSTQSLRSEEPQFLRLAWFLREDGFEWDLVRSRIDGLLRFEGRGLFVPDETPVPTADEVEPSASPAEPMQRLAGWEGRYRMSGGFVPAGLGFAPRAGEAVARSLLSGHLLQIDETFLENGPVKLSRVFAWDARDRVLRCFEFGAGGSVGELRLVPAGLDRWRSGTLGGETASTTTVTAEEGRLSRIERKAMASLGAGVQTTTDIYVTEDRAPR